MGRTEENGAEQHAADAVRLDPDEIRYRELMAQVLAARGAHRDAAVEYGRLARNDPRQRDWLLAEAGERLDAAQAGRAADAARAAVRLDPADAEAQLTLATTLARLGDGAGANRRRSCPPSACCPAILAPRRRWRTLVGCSARTRPRSRPWPTCPQQAARP